MFALIFWNRWTEHIYKQKVVPKHSKYSSVLGCPKKPLLKGQRCSRTGDKQFNHFSNLCSYPGPISEAQHPEEDSLFHLFLGFFSFTDFIQFT